MAGESPRQRFGSTKVRSGCVTCKARHLKCDEGHPACQRCIKLGRTCGGYAPINPAQRRRQGPLVIIKYQPQISIFQSPGVLPGLSSQEQRSLTFFHARTAIEIVGVFPASELWSSTVGQIASHEAAIRHGVIALGALHEHFECLHDPHAPKSDFAMQQYTKAIQKVMSLNLGASPEAADVALLSCVLFAAFESLQGHYKSALTHICSGMKVLSEHEAEHGTSQRRYVTRDTLQPVFVRLDTQAMEIGDNLFRHAGKPFGHPGLCPVPEVFPSINKAYISFDVFFNHFLHFIQTTEAIRDPNPVIERLQAIKEEHIELLLYFNQWSSAFDRACFPQSHPAVLILQIYRAVVGVMQSVDVVVTEMCWDQCIPQFGHIMDLADAFMLTQTTTVATTLSRSKPPTHNVSGNETPSDAGASTATKTSTNSSPKQTHKPTFTLALGIITPLHLTATRCRDPAIRRRALHILSTCNRKEGIWDSIITARVAERVISVEEASAGGVVTDASQIPEWERVRSMETFFGPDRQGCIRYKKSTAIAPTRALENLGRGEGQDSGFGAEVVEIIEW